MIDLCNVYGYIIGEYGDFEVVVWFYIMIGIKFILEIVDMIECLISDDLLIIFDKVKNIVYEIIDCK